MADTLEKLSRGDPTRRSWQNRFLGKWPKLTAMMYQTETELGQERVRSLEDLEKKLSNHSSHIWTGPDQEIWSSGSRTTDHVLYDEERSSALTGSQKGRSWNKCTTIVCVFLVLSIIAAVIAGIGLAILLLKPFHGLETDTHTHGDDHIDAYLGPTEEEYLTKKFCNLVKTLLQGVEFPTDNGIHSCYSTLKLVKGSENLHIELHVVPAHGYTVKEKLRRALREQVLLDGMYRLNNDDLTRYLNTDGSIVDGEFPFKDTSLISDQLATVSTGIVTTTRIPPANDRVNAVSSGIITINRTSYVNNRHSDTGSSGVITDISTTQAQLREFDKDTKPNYYGRVSSITNQTIDKPSYSASSVKEIIPDVAATSINTPSEVTTALLLTQTEPPFPPPIPTVTEQYVDKVIPVTDKSLPPPIPTPPGPTFDTSTPQTDGNLPPSSPTPLPNPASGHAESTTITPPSPPWARSELKMRLPHPLTTMPDSSLSSSYGYFTQSVNPTKDSVLPLNSTVTIPSFDLTTRHNALAMSNDASFKTSLPTIEQKSESTNQNVTSVATDNHKSKVSNKSIIVKSSMEASISTNNSSLPPIFPYESNGANMRPVPINLFDTGVGQMPPEAIGTVESADNDTKRKSKEPFVAESLMSHGVIKLPFKTTSKFRFLFAKQNSDTNGAKTRPDGPNTAVSDLKNIKIVSSKLLHLKGNETASDRKTLPQSQNGPRKTRTKLPSPLTNSELRTFKGTNTLK